MKLSPTLKWTGLALLGLLVAVAVAIAASNLASREIGLSSESISAGYTLSPVGHDERHLQRNRIRPGHADREREARGTATEAEAASPSAPVESEESESEPEADD